MRAQVAKNSLKIKCFLKDLKLYKGDILPILIYIYTEDQAARYASSKLDLRRKEALHAKVTNSAMHVLLRLVWELLRTRQSYNTHTLTKRVLSTAWRKTTAILHPNLQHYTLPLTSANCAVPYLLAS